MILEDLKKHYGASFQALSPSLLDTLDQVDAKMKEARQAARRDEQYVSARRFATRIKSLSGRQRDRLSQVISDMASGTTLHYRHFKPARQDTDLLTMRVVLTHGILLSFLGIVMFAVSTYRCFEESDCSLWDVARRAIVVCSMVTLAIALFVTSYKKTIARRGYNLDISDTNSQTLIQASANLQSIWTGGSSFDMDASLLLKRQANEDMRPRVAAADCTTGQTDMQCVSVSADSTNTTTKTAYVYTGTQTLRETRAGGLAANLVGTRPGAVKKVTVDAKGVTTLEDVRGHIPVDGALAGIHSVQITFTNIVGASALKVRSVNVMDATSGFKYTFRTSMPTVAANGDTIRLPLKSVTSFFKAGPDAKGTFDIQVNLAEAVSEYDSMHATAKRVVDTFDKCNTLSEARAMPFPLLDVAVLAACAVAVLFALAYMFGVLRPLEKVRNVRTLMSMGRRVRMGDKIPEFEAVIACCKTPDDVWTQLINVGVCVLLIFAIYASFIVSSSVGDYKGALYSSIQYAQSKCA
jgi:hypothetical protein